MGFLSLKAKKNNGFTLVELIVVLCILVIIASITWPKLTGYFDNVNAKACVSNRQMIQEYLAYTRSFFSDATLGKMMNGDYLVSANYVKDLTCPRDGVYTAGKKDDSITCSIHGILYASGSTTKPEEPETPENPGGGEEPGGGDTPSTPTYPGTNLPLVALDDVWPKQESFEGNNNQKIMPSGIFQYSDGNYYVICKEYSITKGQASSGPGGDLYQWFGTHKLTGKIIPLTESSQTTYNVTRGDVAQIGNDYYVFIDGGNVGYYPTENPGQWYKVPSK